MSRVEGAALHAHAVERPPRGGFQTRRSVFTSLRSLLRGSPYPSPANAQDSPPIIKPAIAGLAH
jgi:hypothetical protein